MYTGHDVEKINIEIYDIKTNLQRLFGYVGTSGKGKKEEAAQIMNS